MASTNYYSVNGVVRSEASAGRYITYCADVLASVIGTFGQAGEVVNSYRYKPYGAILAQSGAGADPAFLWAGGLGYRSSSRTGAQFYVRSRTYSAMGQWTSKDNSWPSQRPYAYVGGDPVTLVDPSGFLGIAGCCKVSNPGQISAKKYCRIKRDSLPGHYQVIAVVLMHWKGVKFDLGPKTEGPCQCYNGCDWYASGKGPVIVTGIPVMDAAPRDFNTQLHSDCTTTDGNCNQTTSSYPDAAGLIGDATIPNVKLCAVEDLVSAFEPQYLNSTQLDFGVDQVMKIKIVSENTLYSHQYHVKACFRADGSKTGYCNQKGGFSGCQLSNVLRQTALADGWIDCGACVEGGLDY